MSQNPIFSVSDFVAVVNQSLDFAFPFVAVQGEVLEYKVSKNRWVFLTLKDDTATLRCFSTVYALPGPIEEGMLVRVHGSPRLHEKYGFSLQAQQISLVGEGTLKKGFELLRSKLQSEGLFDVSRKRSLPDYPRRVAVVTAQDSAACADFLKIAKARWGGVSLEIFDTYVQGDEATRSIVACLQKIQTEPDLPDAVVIIRGGGSREDLSAFNHEEVARAVAGSRVPTLVAVGHEIDICLAELVADVRASTPSNAAELLFPDKKAQLVYLRERQQELRGSLGRYLEKMSSDLVDFRHLLNEGLQDIFDQKQRQLKRCQELLRAYDPRLPLERGYAIVRTAKGLQITSVASLEIGDILKVQLANGDVTTEVKNTNEAKKEKL